jgi:hypothetical protein
MISLLSVKNFFINCDNEFITVDTLCKAKKVTHEPRYFHVLKVENNIMRASVHDASFKKHSSWPSEYDYSIDTNLDNFYRASEEELKKFQEANKFHNAPD